MAQLKREMGEISRSSEFFSISELQAQTGQPKEKFAAVVLKELMDNAIDAAEAATSIPQIGVVIYTDQTHVAISVSDNGPGIRSRDINRIKDFNVRVSDKLNYRSPSRGQQGNALKTVLGMGYALGSHEPVTITTRGLEHKIYASPNPLGEVVVAHDKKKVDGIGIKGTTVLLALPRSAAENFDPGLMVRAYALANPHVWIDFKCSTKNYHDNSGEQEIEEISDLHQNTVQISKQWRKFITTDLTAPSWYNTDTLKRQIFTVIKTNSDLPLREFILRNFRGLTRNDKAKAVCDDARLKGIGHLSDFESNPEQIATLLNIMTEVAEPPSPKVLGSIGKDHFRAKFAEWYGIEQDLYYKRAECVVNGIPYIIEAACSEVETDRGQVFHLLNFSPTFNDPLSDTLLVKDKVRAYGFRGFMRACYVDPRAPDYETARQDVSIDVSIALHIVSPAFEFLDRGKTRVSLPPEVGYKVAEVLWAVGKSFYTEGERRKKDAYRQAKRDEELEREWQSPSVRIHLIDAVNDVLPKAVSEVADYPVSVRDLYYVVRKLIQQHTDAELEYSYFSNLLAEYEQAYGKILNLYRDARGFLYEPYTGKRIQLGTREVENYKFPTWLYNKILFVEKKGFVEPFIQAQIPERYDLGIVASEGYATKAIRTLFQNADRTTDFKLFVMHDADHLGYNIGRTMREATARMPDYHVDVIDLGLTVQEALDMELPTEDYSRANALPSELLPSLTPLEIEYFSGKQVGNKTWKCKRVELNALGPEERIAFLERKLAEHGATAKVLPSDEVLADRYIQTRDKMAREIARRKIEDYLDIDAIVNKGVESAEFVNPEFGDVKEALITNPVSSWSELLDLQAKGHAREAMENIPWAELISKALNY